MPSPTAYDLVIRNALILDGTGAQGRAGDLAIDGGTIARIEDAGTISAERARTAIEAEGMALAPGFIDAHTHDDRAVIDQPEMTFKVSQGVTSVVVGNCGISLSPLTLEGAPPPLLDPDDHAVQPALGVKILPAAVRIRSGRSSPC